MTVLRLEGRLVDVAGRELEWVCARAIERTGRVRVDLSGLTFLDATGAGALERLRALGVCASGGSRFINDLWQGYRP